MRHPGSRERARRGGRAGRGERGWREIRKEIRRDPSGRERPGLGLGLGLSLGPPLQSLVIKLNKSIIITTIINLSKCIINDDTKAE